MIDRNTNVQPLHQSFIVAQMLNLPLLPNYCKTIVSRCFGYL